jgi:hypothetical protein
VVMLPTILGPAPRTRTPVNAAGTDRARPQGPAGTAPVMEADFFRDRFAAHALVVLRPPASDRELVDRVIFLELTRGVVSARRAGSTCASWPDCTTAACTASFWVAPRSRCSAPVTTSHRRPCSIPPVYPSTGPSGSAWAWTRCPHEPVAPLPVRVPPPGAGRRLRAKPHSQHRRRRGSSSSR